MVDFLRHLAAARHRQVSIAGTGLEAIPPASGPRAGLQYRKKCQEPRQSATCNAARWCTPTSVLRASIQLDHCSLPVSFPGRCRAFMQHSRQQCLSPHPIVLRTSRAVQFLRPFVLPAVGRRTSGRIVACQPVGFQRGHLVTTGYCQRLTKALLRGLRPRVSVRDTA